MSEILGCRSNTGFQTRRGDCLVEIVRQRRLKTFPFLGTRMPKSKFPCVQHLTEKILCGAGINFITDHRMAEMMKVYPNLMGPSAVQPAFNETGPIT